MVACVARHAPPVDVWREKWRWQQRPLRGLRAEPARDGSGCAWSRHSLAC